MALTPDDVQRTFNEWQDAKNPPDPNKPNDLRSRVKPTYDKARFAAEQKAREAVAKAKPVVEKAWQASRPYVKGVQGAVTEVTKNTLRGALALPGAAANAAGGVALGYTAFKEPTKEAYPVATADTAAREELVRQKGLTPQSQVKGNYFDQAADIIGFGGLKNRVADTANTFLTATGQQFVPGMTKVAEGLKSREGNWLGYGVQDMVGNTDRDLGDPSTWTQSYGIPKHIAERGDVAAAKRYIFNRKVAQGVDQAGNFIGAIGRGIFGDQTVDQMKQNWSNYTDPNMTLPTQDAYDQNTGLFTDEFGNSYRAMGDGTNQFVNTKPMTATAAPGKPAYYGQYSPVQGMENPMGVSGLSQNPRFSKDPITGTITVNDDYGLGKRGMTVDENAAGIRGAYKIQGPNGTEYTDAPGTALQRGLGIKMTADDVAKLDAQGQSEMSAGMKARALARMTPSEAQQYQKNLVEAQLDQINLAKQLMDLEEARSGKVFGQFDKAFSMLKSVGGERIAQKYAPILAKMKEPDPMYITAATTADGMSKALDAFKASPTVWEYMGEVFTNDPTGKFGQFVSPEAEASAILDIFNAFTQDKDGKIKGKLSVGGRTLTMSDIEGDDASREALSAIIQGMNIPSVRNLLMAMAGKNESLKEK